MKLAVDVYYLEKSAYAAAVAFSSWKDEKHQGIFGARLSNISAYRPGAFYKRELPCILRLLQEHNLKPEFIIIDGYVFLDGDSQTGLGKHLYDALSGQVKIIGVAKRPFSNIPKKCELLRGDSRRPLYVTSAGVAQEEAKKKIKSMAGKHRVPYLLKKVDQVCRKMAIQR